MLCTLHAEVAVTAFLVFFILSLHSLASDTIHRERWREECSEPRVSPRDDFPTEECARPLLKDLELGYHSRAVQ